MNTFILRRFLLGGNTLRVTGAALLAAASLGIDAAQSPCYAASIVVIKAPNPLPLDRPKIIGDARFRPRSVQLKKSVRVTLHNSLTDQQVTRELAAGDTLLVSAYRSNGITVMIGNQQALVGWDDTDAMERAVVMAKQAVDPDTEIRLVPPPPPTPLEAMAYQDHEGPEEKSYQKEKKNFLRNRYKENYLKPERWTQNQAFPLQNDPTKDPSAAK